MSPYRLCAKLLVLRLLHYREVDKMLAGGVQRFESSWLVSVRKQKFSVFHIVLALGAEAMSMHNSLSLNK